MRPHWNRLPIIGAVLICFVLLMNPGIYCQSGDTETVSNDQVYAYTPVLWRQTTQGDFQSGTTMRTDLTSSAGNVVLAKANNVAPTVYALAGGDSDLFYYYSLSSNKWTRAADAPDVVAEGGRITSDGQNYVYAFPGGSSQFWRFDISANTWATLAAAPGTISSGSDLQFAGDTIFALQGGGNTAVWAYDILSNTWSNLPITGTLYGMSAGSCIAIAGGFVYSYRPSNPYLARVAETGGTWASTYVTQPSDHSGPGADVVATSSSSIAFLYGGGTKTFKTYSITSKTWTSLQNTPGSINDGGGLAYQPANTLLTNPSYFALAGGGSKSFWKFSTTDNRWSNMASVPTQVNAGGGLTYVYSSSAQYFSSGYFTSSVHDNGQSGEVMNSVIWDANVPNSANQNIFLEVRVSDTLSNGVPNAPWTTVVSQSLTSGTSTFYSSLSGYSGRYVQFRVDMSTTDPAVTPVLNEVRLYSQT